MPYEPEGYYVVKGKFTWAQLGYVLGKSEYGTQKDTENLAPEEGEPCGLAPSPEGLSYQIYNSWKKPLGSRVAHIVLHPDGVCFSGALCVAQDWEYAKELFLKVKSQLEKFQPVASGTHQMGAKEEVNVAGITD